MPINKPSSKKPVILILEYGDQCYKKKVEKDVSVGKFL